MVGATDPINPPNPFFYSFGHFFTQFENSKNLLKSNEYSLFVHLSDGLFSPADDRAQSLPTFQIKKSLAIIAEQLVCS